MKAYQQDLATVGQAIARLKLKQERTPNLSADDLLDLRRRLDLVVRALQSGDVAAEIKPRPAALSHDVIAGAATNDPGEGSGEEDVNSTETDNRPPDAADRPRDGSDDLGPQGEQFGNKAWDAPDHSTHSRGNDGRSTTEDAEGNRASWWDSDLGATADQPADRDQAGGDTDPDLQAMQRRLLDIEIALDRLARLTPDDIAYAPEHTYPSRSTQIVDSAAGASLWEDAPHDAGAPPTYVIVSKEVLDNLPATLAEDIDIVAFASGDVPFEPLFDRLVQRHRTSTAAIAQSADDDPFTANREQERPHATGDVSVRPYARTVRPQPAGVADLLIVREHLVRYEGGDVAHVENVLKSEKRERRTRRLERTEEQILVETERSNESERDTQSTDRFSLNREVNDTLRQDSSLQAGVNVTARYGMTVEVNANLDYQSQTSSERSERVATEFSRDVVDRSVQRLSDRTRELRSTLRVQEFEDRNIHGFENRGAGAANVSGVYQWVNRVNEAQVVNYGRRIMFDVVLPDPASLYLHASTNAATEGRLRDPGEFTLRPDEITEWTYLALGQEYGATNLDPPPPLTTAVSKAITETKEAGTLGLVAKSEMITIPSGYQAVTADWTRTLTHQGLLPHVLFSGIAIAGRFHGILGAAGGTINGLAPIQGDIPVVLAAGGVLAVSVSIKVTMLRTTAGRAAWQAKVHAALYQAYLTQRSEYDRAVAERLASAVQIRGRNPLRNEELVNVELRRSALSALVGVALPGGPAATPSKPEGYPEVAPDVYAVIAPVVRFLEQSFEWDQITFTFLPYYWGAKAGWKERALLDDADDMFARFLRAGAVRLAFPVRRGFELAVLHFLETGTLWKEGDPPPVVGERFLPLLEEIRGAQEFPADGVPVGKPWCIRVPTTLVKLRADDKLPRWKKGPDGRWAEEDDTGEEDELGTGGLDSSGAVSSDGQD